MRGTVVTFGEIMLRLAPPAFERILQTPRFLATFGGAEANVAVAVAGYGMPARFVTVLPPNPITEAFTGELRRLNVDDSCVIRGPGRFGVYYFEPGVNQRATNVVYDREHSSMALAKPGDIDWSRCLRDAGWFHVTGITPAISQGAADLAMEGVQEARRLGLTISFDLNYRRKLWNYGKPASDVVPGLFRHADVGFIDAEACRRALGIEPGEEVFGEPETAGYRRLAEQVFAHYPDLKMAAMSMRTSANASRNDWSGCLHDRREFMTSRSYRIDQIVDRLGNGDAFAGGLIYGLRTFPSHQEALEFAVAGACLNHSIPGDFNRFSADEVEALLAGGGGGRVQR
jgi:2-dehydro-3-deoxygluconokinase